MVEREKLVNENYGPWKRLSERVHYREYTYSVRNTQFRHYILVDGSNPAHCYCFNPEKNLYWGIWKFHQLTEAPKAPARFVPAVIKASTKNACQFAAEPSAPIAPGSASALMTPPDLPSDILAALENPAPAKAP